MQNPATRSPAVDHQQPVVTNNDKSLEAVVDSDENGPNHPMTVVNEPVTVDDNTPLTESARMSLADVVRKPAPAVTATSNNGGY